MPTLDGGRARPAPPPVRTTLLAVQARRIDVGAVELSLIEAGVGGFPLLLVPGFTGAKEDFADFIEPLAELGWHVVSVDNRGHGDSDKPAGEDAYGLAVFAADTINLIGALGWDRLALVGHSMGGMFVQLVARSLVDRISKLVLMDTGPGPVTGIDPAVVELAISVARTEGMGAVAEALDALPDAPLGSPANERMKLERPEMAVLSDRNTRVCSPEMFAATGVEMLHAADRLGWFDELAMPTLVVVGSEDSTFLEPSREMAAALPDGRFVVIDDAGHSPQKEAPAAWWAAITEFLGPPSGAG